jgi:hypothetical protein
MSDVEQQILDAARAAFAAAQEYGQQRGDAQGPEDFDDPVTRGGFVAMIRAARPFLVLSAQARAEDHTCSADGYERPFTVSPAIIAEQETPK